MPTFVARYLLLLSCASAALLALSPHASARVTTPERDLPPGAVFPDSGPSTIIYPPEAINLRFEHATHLRAGLGLACTSCHPGATTSTRARDRLLPDPAVCDRCHGSNHHDTRSVTPGVGAQGACAFCHLGYRDQDGGHVARTDVPVARLHSNHKAHADRRIGCASCHGAVQDIGLATREQLGRMRGCFGCHDQQGEGRGDASNACTTCHLTGTDGTLQTSFRDGHLSPPRWMGAALEHTPDFLVRHKQVAGANSATCANCHSEAYCTDCHDGRVRPRAIHPNDYLSMHPIEARLDNPRCASCHQATQFCLPCHQRSGVAWSAGAGSNHAQGRFHPPQSVWTNPPRTSQHHAWEAERNLSACVSCHTERDCVVCHGAQGVGGQGHSPHPAHFALTCGSAARRNPRPCLVCHDPGDASLASCR